MGTSLIAEGAWAAAAWIEGGLNVSGGIFSGLKVNLESLQALLSGGVAFATPDALKPAAKNGDEFWLNSESKKEWEDWAGAIPISPPAPENEGK